MCAAARPKRGFSLLTRGPRAPQTAAEEDAKTDDNSAKALEALAQCSCSRPPAMVARHSHAAGAAGSIFHSTRASHKSAEEQLDRNLAVRVVSPAAIVPLRAPRGANERGRPRHAQTALLEQGLTNEVVVAKDLVRDRSANSRTHPSRPPARLTAAACALREAAQGIRRGGCQGGARRGPQGPQPGDAGAGLCAFAPTRTPAGPALA
jgi:hypothetical protein